MIYSAGLNTTRKIDAYMHTLALKANELGILLSNAQLLKFQKFCEQLTDWNNRMNLTSITGLDQIIHKHFLDSLSVNLELRHSFTVPNLRVLDVGSGAGFPGIPIQISFPDIRVSVLESSTKKCSFLSHIADELGLVNLSVLSGRSETLAHDPVLRENFDVVISRAVAKLPILSELTLPFCKVGGLVLAYKSDKVTSELNMAHNSIRIMGGEVKNISRINSICGLPTRTLVVIGKLRNTPHKYPRRPGIPSKRPM